VAGLKGGIVSCPSYFIKVCLCLSVDCLLYWLYCRKQVM
jgi:hypothetical protein